MNDLKLNNTVLQLKVVNISIVGSSKTGQPVTVQCEGNSGILLHSLTGFYLQGLHFKGCSFDITPYRAYVSDHNLPSNYTSVYVNYSRSVHISECSFDNHHGSSILLENVYLDVTVESSNFTGNGSLLDDTELRSGGIVIGLYRDTIHATGYRIRVRITSCNFNSNFNKNINDTICIDRSEARASHRHGGAIDIKHDVGLSSLYIFIENCRFQHNVATNGGAVSVLTSGFASVSILNSSFTNNMAYCQGGALMFAHYNSSSSLCKFELIGCVFTNNSAYWGGALAVIYSGCSSSTSINFTNNVFTSNTASGPGFAIALSGPDLVDSLENEKVYLQVNFSGTNNVLDNRGTGEHSGAIRADNSLIVFCEHSDTYIYNSIGTAMNLHNSKVFFNGTIVFANNSGYFGGAIYIKYDSLILFGPLSKSNFIDNVASILGGAVYSSVTQSCTFDDRSFARPDQVYFARNYANLIEQSIYIESTGQCSQSSEDFYSKFQFVPNVTTQILFPLYNVRISFEPDVRRVMLGEKFNLKPTMMLDKFEHVSVGTGYLRFQRVNLSNSTVAYNMRGPSTISLDNYTGKLQFFVVGPEITEDISVVINLYFRREESYGVGKAEINFTLIKCRLGYEYSHEKEKCVCEDQSPNDLFKCDRHGKTLCVKRHYWYSIDFKTTYPCPAQNCWFMYGRCPKISRLCSNYTEYSASGRKMISVGRAGQDSCAQSVRLIIHLPLLLSNAVLVLPAIHGTHYCYCWLFLCTGLYSLWSSS